MRGVALGLCLAITLSLACNCPVGRSRADSLPDSVAVRRLTAGPAQHFASAYYHLRSVNASGTRVLCLETALAENRNPVEGETATVGLVDLATGEFKPLSKTQAWNFQQGAMQQWLGSSPDTLVTFNDLREGRFVSVVHNVFTGEERVLGRALSGVSADGRKGLSLNFA
ncbi:hypothetical protein LLH00_12490, partial [bacterium]|nr:hypothetical protein [bacterium]